jgi:hypothetical protein
VRQARLLDGGKTADFAEYGVGSRRAAHAGAYERERKLVTAW